MFYKNYTVSTEKKKKIIIIIIWRMTLVLVDLPATHSFVKSADTTAFDRSYRAVLLS